MRHASFCRRDSEPACFNRLNGVPIDLKARGAVSVSEHLAAIVEAVHSSSPAVLVIEQSTGLVSHHPESYKAFNSGLGRLPYVFYNGSVEASVECGASHARDRLVWIGIRPPGDLSEVRVIPRGVESGG